MSLPPPGNVTSLQALDTPTYAISPGNEIMFTANLSTEAASLIDGVFDKYVSVLQELLDAQAPNTQKAIDALIVEIGDAFQGVFGAFIMSVADNFPTADARPPDTQTIYTVTEAVTQSLGGPRLVMNVGDWLIYSGTWKIIPGVRTNIAYSNRDMYDLMQQYFAATYPSDESWNYRTVRAALDYAAHLVSRLLQGSGMPLFQSFRTDEVGFEINLPNNVPSMATYVPNFYDTAHAYIAISALHYSGTPVVCVPDAAYDYAANEWKTKMPIRQLVYGLPFETDGQPISTADIDQSPGFLETCVFTNSGTITWTDAYEHTQHSEVTAGQRAVFDGSDWVVFDGPAKAMALLCMFSTGKFVQVFDLVPHTINYALVTTGPANSLIRMSDCGPSTFWPEMYSGRAYILYDKTPSPVHPFQTNIDASTGGPALVLPTTLNNPQSLDFFEFVAIGQDWVSGVGNQSYSNCPYPGFGFDITAVDQFQFNLGFGITSGAYTGTNATPSKWLTTSFNTSRYVRKQAVKQYLTQPALQNVYYGSPISWATSVSKVESGGIVAPANTQAPELFNQIQLTQNGQLWKDAFGAYMKTHAYPWIHYNGVWYSPAITTGIVGDDELGKSITSNTGLKLGDSYQAYTYGSDSAAIQPYGQNSFIVPFNDVVAFNGGTNVATGKFAWFGNIANKTLGAQVAKFFACIVEANVVSPPPDALSKQILYVLSKNPITLPPSDPNYANLLLLEHALDTIRVDSHVGISDSVIADFTRPPYNIPVAFVNAIQNALVTYGISSQYFANNAVKMFQPYVATSPEDTRPAFQYIDEYSRALLSFGNHFYTFTYGDQLGLANFIEYSVVTTDSMEQLGTASYQNRGLGVIWDTGSGVRPATLGGGSLVLFSTGVNDPAPATLTVTANGKMVLNGAQVGSNSTQVQLSASVNAGASVTWQINGTTTSNQAITSIILIPGKSTTVQCRSSNGKIISFTLYVNLTSTLLLNGSNATNVESAQAPFTFSMQANGGFGTPQYQWTLNGQAIGTNANSLVLRQLTDGASVTCNYSDSSGSIRKTMTITLIDVTLSVMMGTVPVTNGQTLVITQSTAFVAKSQVNVAWYMGTTLLGTTSQITVAVPVVPVLYTCTTQTGLRVSFTVISTTNVIIRMGNQTVTGSVVAPVSTGTFSMNASATGGPGQNTFIWFNGATRIGLGQTLELQAASLPISLTCKAVNTSGTYVSTVQINPDIQFTIEYNDQPVSMSLNLPKGITTCTLTAVGSPVKWTDAAGNSGTGASFNVVGLTGPRLVTATSVQNSTKIKTVFIVPHISIAAYAYMTEYGLTDEYLPAAEPLSREETLVGLLMSKIHDEKLGFEQVMLDAFAKLIVECSGASMDHVSAVQGAMCTSPAWSSEIAAVLFQHGTNTQFRERLVALLIYAFFMPGFRIVDSTTPTGQLRWILDVDGTDTGPYTTAGETRISNWLNSYGSYVNTPNDFIILMMYELEVSSSSQVWTPIRTITPNDTIASGPNSVPSVRSAYPITIAKNGTNSIFNPAVLYQLAEYAFPIKSSVSTTKVIKRWVSALLSDEPWTYYEEQLDSSIPALDIIKQLDQVGFDMFWSYTVSVIPTFRQVLQAALGFSI